MNWRSNMRNKLSVILCALLIASTPAMAEKSNKSALLSVVGTSKRQWTSVVVAKDRRVFVNFPRWSDNVPNSVDQLLKDSSTLVFPDKNWNEWKGVSPADHFVCVQSLFIDKDNA